MRWMLISLQVFALMCAPIPQSSYAAVAVGRTLGMGMAIMFGMYIVSDVAVFLTYWWLTRRVGQPGLSRLQRRLPAWAGGRLGRAVGRAGRGGSGAVTLSSIFAAGYASLYLAVLLTTLRRAPLLPALAVAVAADVLQFSGTLALAGVLARVMPVPGAEWAGLVLAPLLAGVTPAAIRAARPGGAGMRRVTRTVRVAGRVPRRLPCPLHS